MLQVIFPDVKRGRWTNVMKEVKQFANSEDTYRENSFIDAVLHAVTVRPVHALPPVVGTHLTSLPVA